MFATVETKDKAETDVLAQKWSGLLSTGGVQVKVKNPLLLSPAFSLERTQPPGVCRGGGLNLVY